MSVYRISYRYANSLLQIAEEKKILNKISDDAELVFNTLNASKEFRLILKSPVVKPGDKKNVLTKIFEKKISGDTLSFINFVLEKNREDLLFDIFKEFITLVNKRNGVVKATIFSATELDVNTKEKIGSKFGAKLNKKISADYKVNPDLIGGVLVKIEDTVYDSSVRHQLALLSKKLSEEIVISNN